ncbi:hypothetical protein SAMN05519104_7798 [Rhizobiales bacterium GAS188]|nr:hypothetical protein SAMN05519104_7798 [Rhizobiales bacterium GAS188]
MRTFTSHFEKALRVSALAAINGRLQGVANVVLADVANPAITRTAPAPYELFGPGDVKRLAAGAITRRFPAPGASNAEATKLALVEFPEPDAPWRYTPERPVDGRLRPWLVLVVGRRAPDDIILRPDGRVTLGLAAQSRHPLSQSWRWAHVHQVENHDPIARLVAPPLTGPGEPGYLADTEYVACVVPAFTAAGADSWDGGALVTCDLYDSWTFRTGPKGDFPELAHKLHPADLAADQKPGGKPFGRAEVAYHRRAKGVGATVLATAGALRLPSTIGPGAPPDPADAAPAPDIAAEVAALTRRIVTPDGRAVVTAPRYDAPFSDANAAGEPAARGWIDQLRSDPRLRGAAGLGAWTAISWQDRISDAAAAKAGDLAIARDRIGHVALGIEASRSLWRRRLPARPVDRLALLSPTLGRLATTTGASVLDQVAGRTADLTRALLSSAARRALRPGPARTALTRGGVAPFGDVLIAANVCPEAHDPAEIRRGDVNRDETIRRLVFDAARGDDVQAERILQALDPASSPGKLAAALRALAPGPNGRPDPEAIARFPNAGPFPDADQSLLEWPGWMRTHAPREPCNPVDLDKLAAVVTAAVDPTVARPPAVRRVLSTLPGVTHIGPVEIEPELDLPLWSFLAARSPDWMLPGAGDLVDGDVVALATNPVFVESLLVGANYQATGELRWRNIPLASRWSPLRKFWQRASGEFDILPIRTWPEATALGGAPMAPAGRAAEAVVAFRTSLFRRYPATVVYLYPADPPWTPPPASAGLDPNKHKPPTFSGTIGPDITFFGFKLPPEALKTHWVVLEEPPAGYRFYHKAASPAVPHPLALDGTSSNFALQHFAVPVRVLIGPLLGQLP